MSHDVIIVGGGPAGLSAALLLGRSRRNVLLFDSGAPRNAPSRGVYGFLGLDGLPPAELRQRAREQLARYPDVRLVEGRVIDAERVGSHLAVTDAAGHREEARVLLLATGLLDELPPAAGAERLWGRGLFTCPLCDGFEAIDQPLVAIGAEEKGGELALSLTTYSDDIVLVVQGGEPPHGKLRRELERCGVKLRAGPVVAFEGEEKLESVVLGNGERMACEAAFVGLGQRPASDLEQRVGPGPGLYKAGDAAEQAQLAIVAAADGARAAKEIHRLLRQEETG